VHHLLWTNSNLKKQLTLLILLLTTATCLGQVTVTGKVIFNNDKSEAPGVNVVEKGTKNGTQTEQNGSFKLTVSDPNAVLVFTFIGVITQEIPLNGKSEILVKLTIDCNKDFFDSRQVHIYANSGVINNPVGGQVDIASPWIFNGIIKGSFGYQTNLLENKMQIGQVEAAHYISNCDFDIDFRWSYRQVNFNNKLDFRVNSFETDLNLSETKFIAGYSQLDFTRIESADNKILSGLSIGVGRYFNIPFYPTATLKVGLYKDKVEYQASIQGGLQGLLCFIKFYKLDEFNELSLGIGKRFVYGLKRRKG